MAKQKKWNVKVDGLEELVKVFEKMPEVAQEALDSASKEAANVVLQSAKRNCPVKSGKLRDSLDIKAEKTSKPTKRSYQVYSKGVSQGGVRYAFAVEAGTSKAPAKPFLRPALDENKENIKKTISEKIIEEIDKL